MDLSVPYSTSTMDFHLPSTVSVDIASSRTAQPVQAIKQAIQDCLCDPIGSPPLRKLADAGDRVCIAFTDITRSSPDALLVPAMLDELKAAGIKDEDITLLCAVGMHRSSTAEEKVSKLGAEIAARYRVIDNEPQNPHALVNLGLTSGKVPVHIHRAAVEADLLISTGIVEPHQYAGYSGGRKTVAIGAAGEPTIAHTHGPTFIDHPGTRLGQIEGNPFHEAISEAAHRAGLKFILNVVLDEDKHIVRVAAGHPEEAFMDLVTFAKKIYEVPVPKQYDVAIGGVGHPKDSNIYQASRAASYLYFAPTPVIKPGGFLIIPARCEEGAGNGVGEQRFYTAMRDAPDIPAILNDARQNGYPPGQQRAFVLAKVLEHNPIIFVGSQDPQLIMDCKMIPAATMEEAFEIVSRQLGNELEVLLVPHAMQTLPVVHKTEGGLKQ